MIRLLGAALVAAGCAWIGFRAAAALDNRVKALRALEEGLSLLAQELELDGSAMPQLMDRLIPRSSGPARSLFQGCRQALERLEEEEFSQAWRRLVEAREELGEAGRQILLPLGDTLGRCGCQEQRQALELARRRLGELAERTEAEHRRQGRVYQVLGLSGGAFLVILLL